MNQSDRQEFSREKVLHPGDISLAWVSAISSAGGSAVGIGDVNFSIAYMDFLRIFLDRKKELWEQPPDDHPPEPIISTDQDDSMIQAPLMENPIPHLSLPCVTTRIPKTVDNYHNRFSIFMKEGNDTSATDYHTDSTSIDTNRLKSSINNGSFPSENDYPVMTMRQLMIRVLTSLGELLQQRARQFVKKRPPQWEEGAKAYALSYTWISNALVIADEHFAKLLSESNLDMMGSGIADERKEARERTLEMKKLADDAKVVNVAISHFANDRNMYQNAAEKKKNKLKAQLSPQWQSRDEVKLRIGTDKWKSNPAPKNNYAALRKADEKELKEIERTLSTLASLDTTFAIQRSREIYFHMTGTNVDSNADIGSVPN